ncbi:unnamed protein product [Paramecium primaurelia]|uniref:Uncharacterized protein n=1 Tax=Paramecium primaurelia TaxID=5886 RepID=A0A8S1NM21_PARPR|nr:unnamed protein product [Paramecium primaurelia]
MNNLYCQKKKRIHEVTYAQKVINSVKPDIENIKLNENLFQAQQMARHSSTLIKDIQKDVRLTLKKYDSYVKMSESNRKMTDKQVSQSTRRYQSESPLKQQESTDKELETLRQQQRILMTLLNNLQQQENLIVSQSFPIPEPHPKSVIDKEWFQQKTKQLQQIQNTQAQIENTSSKRLDKSDVIQIDLSKVKRSPNSKSSSAQNFFSPNKNPIKNSLTYIQNSTSSYAKLHRKQSNSPQKWGQYGVINQQKPQKNLIVSKRNEQWKQRVDNKIKNELIKKQEREIKACTFKPKILSKTPKSNRNSKETSTDFNELMFLIDDINEFNDKNKRSTIKK